MMKTFRRYVQNYPINDVPHDTLIHPPSTMAWDNMAEHWIEQESDFDIILYHDDYKIRMQPHVLAISISSSSCAAATRFSNDRASSQVASS